ncbi:MAG: glycine--tRNA ligase subunit beta [Gammaproteobacteria bacterium]|nr:glycine--tRNA ligase subunit beta [Gammaproteobacteria bacterium]
MAEHADLLFELGTEELPPTALRRLSGALCHGFAEGLRRSGLSFGTVRGFATPRRLALTVEGVALRQPDREVERRGPAFTAAFGPDGLPTRAAEGFARSCGVTVADLERVETEKGAWLTFRSTEAGRPAAEVLPGIVGEALAALPIPKRMRWGDGEAEFVRPVHWVVFLHGGQVVPCEILGCSAGRRTRGHRFHHGGEIEIGAAGAYERLLEEEGRVIADFGRRAERVRAEVHAAAETLGGVVELDEALLEEVTALVEWPVAITAGFEERFLAAPQEALVLTMKKNQKYFPVVDDHGRLLPRFITIANLDSPRPEVIRAGNERVVRPRLADAMFFWEQDGNRRLEARLESLRGIVFQSGLGSLHDKSVRVSRLAAGIARQLGEDDALAERAGLLSRCDLVTEMVFEFPEMQGVMGRYQALRDGEPPALAAALEEFYRPRHSGDVLPEGGVGLAVALADRLDTLVGIFGLGQRPTGDKDPFALRRAALGALRMLVERRLPLDLADLLGAAAAGLRPWVPREGVAEEVFDFMLERLKGLYADQGVSTEVFEAVADVRPTSPADFDLRVRAVTEFRALPEASALAAANKRIRNLLKKAVENIPQTVEIARFGLAEEEALYDALRRREVEVEPLLEAGDYTEALRRLATLREPVDRFFDTVMVMAEDAEIRANRLALLASLYRLFRRVADVGQLGG